MSLRADDAQSVRPSKKKEGSEEEVEGQDKKTMKEATEQIDAMSEGNMSVGEGEEQVRKTVTLMADPKMPSAELEFHNITHPDQ